MLLNLASSSGQFSIKVCFNLYFDLERYLGRKFKKIKFDVNIKSDHEDFVGMRTVRGWKKNIDWSFLARYKYDKITSTADKIEIDFTGVIKCSACDPIEFEFKNLKANNVCSFVTKMQSKFCSIVKVDLQSKEKNIKRFF